LAVPIAIRSMKIDPVQTSYQSPWQNGVAERWIESCRRDLLDHVIPITEQHLKRLLADYVRYYHEVRTHLGLEKETPVSRRQSATSGRVLSLERLGGLHHRYERLPDPTWLCRPSSYLRTPNVRTWMSPPSEVFAVPIF
jgi:hypothetical protein